MKKQELLDFCQQIGEVEILTPKKAPDHRLDESHVQDVRIDGDWTVINQKENPSLGFKLKKINPHIEACQIGCGDIVENQKLEYRLYHYDEGWRIRCVNCQRAQGPNGELLMNHAVNAAWMQHRRSLKK